MSHADILAPVGLSSVVEAGICFCEGDSCNTQSTPEILSASKRK